MTLNLSRNQIGLLLLINRLHQRNTPLGRSTLFAIAEIKLPGVARYYDTLFSWLIEQSLVSGTPEAFSLTRIGVKLVDEVAGQYSLHAWFYDEYYQAVLNSQAHARFCERVYGIDLCQHGMTDLPQLKLMLRALQVTPGMALLDFGCGDGRIAEYIAETEQVHVTGVDIAAHAIALAQDRTQSKRDHLTFACADVDLGSGDFPTGLFDRILAIDSIFFVSNLDKALSLLTFHLKPDGMMGLTFHYPAEHSPEQSGLGAVLAEAGLPFTTLDLTAQNIAHWHQKKQVLSEMQEEFAQEGAAFLFKNRLAECQGWETLRRSLFIIRKA
jgi:SAM-dependent methyltransferase